MTMTDPGIIATALFPKVRQRVLDLLFSRPDRALYLREIVRLTGLGVGHVQRELQRLERGGIISRTKRGQHVYFQANPACPIFEELRRLMAKTVGVVAVISHVLGPLADHIVAAFIYGSVARGDELATSDLDLMVIGDVSFRDIVDVVRDAEVSVSRAINPTVYPLDEFRTKLTTGHHFLNSVMEREKLFVVGDADEFGSLLGEQLDPTP